MKLSAASLAAGIALVLLTACGSTVAADYDVSPDEVPAAEEEAPIVEPVQPAEQQPAAPEAAAAAGYDVGDAFDENCSVAWPSSPAVTATDIQITAQCSGVPSSYPLVLVVYGDPGLPITPSTTTFRVIGEVYGSGTSQAGMPYLIVLADQVQL